MTITNTTRYLMNSTLSFVILLVILTRNFGETSFGDSPKWDPINTKWDHEVDSSSKLRRALKSKSNIVQADIMVVDSFEKIGKEWIYVRNQPVMGKPKDTFTFTSTFKIYKETFWPSKVYSLTLKQFLDKWCASHTQKTLKLDFTSAIALTSSLKIMIDTFKNIQYRLWLSFNIEYNSKEELWEPDRVNMNAKIFFLMASTYFPNSLFSLSWTKYPYYKKNYPNICIPEMLNAVKKSGHNKNVNYAIWASLAANSEENIKSRLNKSPETSTLTFWCNDPKDKIDYKKLAKLVDEIGVNRVYLDLNNMHQTLLNELKAIRIESTKHKGQNEDVYVQIEDR